jgi:hypothetical protein
LLQILLTTAHLHHSGSPSRQQFRDEFRSNLGCGIVVPKHSREQLGDRSLQRRVGLRHVPKSSVQVLHDPQGEFGLHRIVCHTTP